MRKRDVVGRRIVDVRYRIVQTRDQPSESCTVVDAFVLDNGREVRPWAFETEDAPIATLLLSRPRGRRSYTARRKKGDRRDDET